MTTWITWMGCFFVFFCSRKIVKTFTNWSYLVKEATFNLIYHFVLEDKVSSLFARNIWNYLFSYMIICCASLWKEPPMIVTILSYILIYFCFVTSIVSYLSDMLSELYNVPCVSSDYITTMDFMNISMRQRY